MDDFCELYWRLDSTTKTNEKIEALKTYFKIAKPADASWAVSFLTGQRLKRLVPTKQLRTWAIEQSGISAWLFEECYERVGDLAETISLIVHSHLAAQTETTEHKCDASESTEIIDSKISLKDLVEQELLPLGKLDVESKRERVVSLWRRFDQQQLFVLGKLMTGGFRVGVSKKLVVRALAEHSKIDAATIAHRLMGSWEPTAESFNALLDPDDGETAISKPYPFFLANPLKDGPDLTLGQSENWIAEWKWDGVRAQLIRREGQSFIWSRGEDLVTEQFPEVSDAAGGLPDGTVIDGEIVGWSSSEDRPLEFAQLQRRLGRKSVGTKLRSEVPVVMLAFDLLELDGVDFRQQPLEQRQSRLIKLMETMQQPENSLDQQAESVATQGMLFPEMADAAVIETVNATVTNRIRFSQPAVSRDDVASWEDLAKLREEAKALRAEGLMLKRRDSTYQVGRPVGDWWKWKVDPYTIDAVLIYAQRGHGRRASLYTDYTFAVWDQEKLVPFAKAYSGLTDSEIRKVDAFVRKNTTEKFGPVRSVTPELVFELAFENIQRSPRHKSGIAVRFPRISRWRHDKGPQDADTLNTILAMIDGE